MRRSSWLGVGALVLASTTAFGQPPGGPPGQDRGFRGGPDARERGDGPPTNPLLEALDTNGDHVLSAEEIQQASAALAKLDKNQDGQLTGEELRPLGRRPDGEAGRPGRGPREAGPGAGGPPREDAPPPPAAGPGPGRGRGGPGGPGGPRGGQAGPAGDAPRPDPSRFVEHALEFDANDDGQLNREELLKLATEMMNRRPFGDMRGGPGDAGPGGPGAGGPRGGRPAGAGPGRGGDESPRERPARPDRPE